MAKKKMKMNCQNCFRILFFYDIQNGLLEIKCRMCKHITVLECEDGNCELSLVKKPQEN